MQKLVVLFLFLCSSLVLAQVKVGDNINTIDAASILELESQTKVFVPTRMSSAEMNTVSPLNGAIVYNTDSNCIFVFDGSQWKSLCNSEITVTTSAMGPSMNMVGDIWINDAENLVSIWNGAAWVLINKNPKSGDGDPSPTTAADPIAGDIYVNRIDGNIFTYNGIDWINNNATIQVGNGLTNTPLNILELGGELTKATAIETNTTNTLALEGLEVIEDNANMVVTIEETTGILRRAPISSFTQKEEIVVIANDGQNQFNTPSEITNAQKIDVYRNGVKIDFSAIGTNLIELETNVICYQNDEIRIVQFF